MMIEIASPIKWFIGVLKYVNDRQITNREERFHAFELIFLDLLKIHREQIKMLRQGDLALPVFLSLDGNSYKWRAGMDASVIAEDEVPIHIERVKRFWKTTREDSAGERVALRAKSSKLLCEVKDSIERRFLFSVMNYFINPEQTYLISEHIDEEVTSLIEKGPDEILDSPSLTVWEKIENKTDPTKIKEVFDTSRENLLARWSEICERYAELHTRHISTKPNKLLKR